MLVGSPLQQLIIAPFLPSLELTANPAVDITNANTYTFSAQNTGRPHPLRKTIVLVLTRNGTGATPIAVTKDGSAMTSLLEVQASSGGVSFVSMLGFDSGADSGESADFVVTNTNGTRCKILVYSLIGKTMVPIITATATTVAGNLGSLTCTPADSLVLPSGRPFLCGRYSMASTGTVNQFGAAYRGTSGGAIGAGGTSILINAQGTGVHLATPVGYNGEFDFNAVLESASSTGAECQALAVW